MENNVEGHCASVWMPYVRDHSQCIELCSNREDMPLPLIWDSNHELFVEDHTCLEGSQGDCVRRTNP